MVSITYPAGQESDTNEDLDDEYPELQTVVASPRLPSENLDKYATYEVDDADAEDAATADADEIESVVVDN